MNKFVAVAILALVATLSAADRTIEEERELGLLMGHETLFSQFCMNTRHYISEDIKNRFNSGSSQLIKAFFGAASEITDEVLTVEKSAVEELSRQLANPSKEEGKKVSEPPTEDEISELIQEGKKEIMEKPLMGRFLAAVKSASSTVFNVANSAIFIRLAKLRSQLSQENFLAGLSQTCQQVGDYERKMQADLAAAKANLITSNSEQEVQKFIESASLNQLKCYTSRGIVRINGFCNLLKNASAAFMKMLGLDGEGFQQAMNKETQKGEEQQQQHEKEEEEKQEE